MATETDLLESQVTIEDLAVDRGIPARKVAKWRERGQVPHRERLWLVERARRARRKLLPEAFDRLLSMRELASRLKALADPGI